MSERITCPECQAEIEVTEVMSAQLATTIRSELQAEYAEKSRKLADDRERLAETRKQLEISQADFDGQLKAAVAQEREALTAKLRKEAREALSIEIADRDEQLKANQAKLKDYEAQELELRRKARELEQTAERQELEIARRLDEQRQEVEGKLQAEFAEKSKKLVADRDELTKKLRVEVQQATAVEMADRDEQLKSAHAQLKTFETQELELRHKARELELKAEQQDLELARRLDEERQKVRDTTLKQAGEQHALKEAEKDEKIKGLCKQIDDLKRKAEQGSQQTQGDVQEIALETLLAAAFPNDVVKRVGKGLNGGDVMHHVFDHNGRECGAILWESKRTKAWNDKWLGKLIDDQQAAKATCACIVSAVMPEGVEHIGEVNGVWVSSWSSASSTAVALRRVLIEAAQARVAADGQHGKMELVYNYLSGPEFRNRVRGLVEPYAEMEADLQSEMRAYKKHWNKRKKQLERALSSTSGLYGDLQGIIGSGLQEIEGMEMLSLEANGQFHENATSDNTETI